MIEFVEFPKMGRLTRECVITEKIDGTNAQIYIAATKDIDASVLDVTRIAIAVEPNTERVMFAGSRTQWITPERDNHGFAGWVKAHASDLWALGEGRHFGEWWGSGVQRGYGLPKGEKRLSLFNVSRWALHGTEPQRIPTGDPRVEKWQDELPACVGLVPVLARGLFDTQMVDLALDDLSRNGSKAAPGFMKPEGVVVFHVAANVGFKKTLERDEQPKSKAVA